MVIWGFGDPAVADGAWAYRIAGRAVAADGPVAGLAPFAVARPVGAPSERPRRPAASTAGPTVFAGPAWVGRAERLTRCRRAPDGYWLEVAGAAPLWIAADGLALVRGGPGDDAPRPPGPVDEEVLLGPALALALALQGCFSLHASAVAVDGRAVLFAGDSGAGKSTLAARLSADPVGALRRLGDDILPVGWVDGRPVMWPDFPQLKLTVADQRPAVTCAGEGIPIAAVYLLADVAGRVATAPLRPGEAALALVRHTVAARLFAPDLTRRHLDFVARVATSRPVRTLAFPRRLDIAPAVATAIRSDLAAG